MAEQTSRHEWRASDAFRPPVVARMARPGVWAGRNASVTGLWLWMSLCVFSGTAVGAPLAGKSPVAVVEQTSQQMIKALVENRQALQKDPQKVYGLIDTIALPHFDIDAIVRQVLGSAWARATPEQRSAFKAAFQTFILNTYAKQLLAYSDEKLTVLPVPPDALRSGYVMVRTEIQSSGGQPISVDYRLRRKEGVWKIIDFTVEGISLVINYRQSFAGQIRHEGLNAVIDALTRHNDQFKLEAG
jgi:phospholipid transport system substrate-binding protein